MKMPFFSVIVPVFNVEKYLSRCIESILSQSYDDYELILIDDGSLDSSGDICDMYASLDQRIVVVHMGNEGLSAARNVGIEAATGRYLWFIDSDDWLLSESAFAIICNLLVDGSADLAFFSYRKYFEIEDRFSANLYDGISTNAGVDEWLRTNTYKALAWNKVVRRSIVNHYGMRFPAVRTAEDLTWCADLLVNADNVVICVSPLLAYRQRPDSITSNNATSFRRGHIEDELFLMNATAEKYGLAGGADGRNDRIGNYLGYEYSWLLGVTYPFWSEYSGELKALAYLLNYDACYKTSRVRRLKTLLGLRGASYVLNQYLIRRKLGGM